MAVFPAFFGLLMAACVTGQYVEVTPREAVRRVGGDLTVLCKVDYSIDSCRMRVGTTPYRLLPNIQEGDVVYLGQGLQFGECGAHIKHIKEEWNGNISCELPPKTGSIEVTGTMRLMVARAPDAPQLITPQQPLFREGEQLRAQCVVPNGRPAARILWFLDDEQLVKGTHQPVVESAPGSDLATISQNITWQLRAADGGRRLACRAEHEALDAPREASRQLVVHYPPKRLEGESSQITIFGLKLGAEGRLNVTVRAVPPPAAEWTLADQRLVAPAQNAEATAAALQPIPLGNGFYNVTLVLARVSKEDVERAYYLRVSNDLGRDEFTVRISTMDEPAGVELDAGAIVGIVLAVLVLLLAVSLAVFAKATDRWCFGGRSHRTELPDGLDSEAPLPSHDDIKGAENPSHDHEHDHDHDHHEYIGNGDTKHPEKKPDTAVDTESAAGGHRERGDKTERSRLAELGARVRAALPRARDKVQATAEARADDEKSPEEKKGVVYAELALTHAERAAPAPAPHAEYAEIVYGEPPAAAPTDKE